MPDRVLTPLRLRALDVMLAEAERWNGQRVPDNRVASYLIGCQRDNSPELGRWLADQRRRGTPIAWCAASRGWAEAQALEPGDEVPPWRAGAKEVMRDALAGVRGKWVPAVDVEVLGYLPPPGSCVIYWRGQRDGWQGHLETLIEATPNGYRSIGGNERGGRWYADEAIVRWGNERLLGFVVDDDQTPEYLPPAELDEPDPDFREFELGADEVLARRVQLEPDWQAIREDIRCRVAGIV